MVGYGIFIFTFIFRVRGQRLRLGVRVRGYIEVTIKTARDYHDND